MRNLKPYLPVMFDGIPNVQTQEELILALEKLPETHLTQIAVGLDHGVVILVQS